MMKNKKIIRLSQMMILSLLLQVGRSFSDDGELSVTALPIGIVPPTSLSVGTDTAIDLWLKTNDIERMKISPLGVITMLGRVVMANQNPLQLADTAGDNFIALQAPTVLTSDVTFTLPGADGVANQVLATNGAGQLGWVYGSAALANYRVHAYVGTDQTLLSSGTETVQFNAEVFDPNNNFDVTTFTYTAPLAGIYAVTVNVSCNSVGTGNRRINLIKNGLPLTGFSVTAFGTVGVPLTLSGFVPLVAGDLVRVDYTGLINDSIPSGQASFFIQAFSA